MNQTVTVTLDGTPRKVPLSEALTLSLFQRALAGNVPAAREAIKIMEKVEAQQNAAKEEMPTYVFSFAPPPELRDCNTALEKLDVLERGGPRWCIRPWVVEAALARNSQLVLDENDRQHIEEQMLNRGMLDAIWPKAA
jgi:hypothetical protein